MDYIGQIFGNRKVINNWCEPEDWTKLGLKIPSRPDKYLLTQCLNCGAIIPNAIKNLRNQPPKRCVCCSNIGNHSGIKTNTNIWTVYTDYAVCNVSYNNQIISFYIDKSDYETVSKRVWRVVKKRQKFYLVSGSYKKGTGIYLHEFIFGEYNKDLEIDHIDGNSLNNRRCNLRLVNRQENIDNQRATRIDNQIGIRGVSYCKRGKYYIVDFYYHKKRYYTKRWNNIEDAVWCRYCFEEYFGLPPIKNNPLATQYLEMVAETKKIKIKEYVLDVILRNER